MGWQNDSTFDATCAGGWNRKQPIIVIASIILAYLYVQRVSKSVPDSDAAVAVRAWNISMHFANAAWKLVAGVFGATRWCRPLNFCKSPPRNTLSLFQWTRLKTVTMAQLDMTRHELMDGSSSQGKRKLLVFQLGDESPRLSTSTMTCTTTSDVPPRREGACVMSCAVDF